MENKNPKIRDILYFDFEKASSIWSQFQWGKSESISFETEENSNQNAGINLGLPNIAQAKFGLSEGDKRTIIETRILHHDLLNRIETLLESSNLIIDLNKKLSSDTDSPEVIRNVISNIPYIVGSGWSILEDYKKMYEISDKFNELAKFPGRSVQEGYKKTPEYTELSQKLEKAKIDMKLIKDNKQRAIASRNIKDLNESIQKLITSKITAVEQWIIDGIKLWIKTFVPNRINFRVYPFSKCPSFQILCNLKRESFVDQDLEHLLYGYSYRPNIPLTIF